jgi:hypothetical protein
MKIPFSDLNNNNDSWAMDDIVWTCPKDGTYYINGEKRTLKKGDSFYFLKNSNPQIELAV